MAEKTEIAWCDTTLNLWFGCTQLSPACDHCYAMRWGPRLGVEWNGPPKQAAPSALAKIALYQRTAAKFMATHKHPRRVFINSLSDFFDNQADPEWQRRACQEFELAPDVIIILVTKRPQNVRRRVPPKWMAPGGWPRNVWLIVTGENQVEFDRRVIALMDVPAPVRGVSIEPMLEQIDARWAFQHRPTDIERHIRLSGAKMRPRFIRGLEWAIIGGESGRKARPMPLAWSRDVVNAGRYGTPALFMKQLSQADYPVGFADYATFPTDLQIREFPR